MIDIILDNQLILIALGLAVLPLIAAALLYIIPQLRERLAVMEEVRRQARIEKQKLAAIQQKTKALAKKAAQNRAKAKSASVSNHTPDDADDYIGEIADEYDDVETSVAISHQQASSENDEEDDAEDDVDEEENDESTEEESEVSGEMQSLLTDVFVDEEANARMEVLLSHTVEIESDDLVKKCNEVADKLGAAQ